MNRKKTSELALKYGPVFCQKIDKEWILADQIARVDFTEGGIENCVENIEKFRKLKHYDRTTTKAKIYYSVCETTTHIYIFYAVYHVFDWWKRLHPDNLYDLIRDSLDEHIHDMEGAMLVVSKAGEGRPEWVDGAVTMAHRHFYLYTEQKGAGSDGGDRIFPQKSLYISKFNETIDGNIWIDPATGRVKLYIEAKGHGLFGDHKRWGGGDEIWYYTPKGEDRDPRTANVRKKGVKKDDSNKGFEVGVWKPYDLEDICGPGGLWENRFNPQVFQQHKNGSWGFVYRDKKNNKEVILPGAANPPWSFNDANDKSPIGEIATDPAHFIMRYGQGWGPVSTHYLYNPYLGIADEDE